MRTNDGFDAIFKIVPYFIGFVFIMILCVWGLVGYGVYSVASDPESAAREMGKVVHGFMDEVQK